MVTIRPKHTVKSKACIEQNVYAKANNNIKIEKQLKRAIAKKPIDKLNWNTKNIQTIQKKAGKGTEGNKKAKDTNRKIIKQQTNYINSYIKCKWSKYAN